MSRRKIAPVASYFCLILAVVARDVCAQEWTQWRGPNRDGAVTGFVVPSRWPEQLKKRWRIPVGTGHSTPLIVGKRVYVHSRQGVKEVVAAYDLDTGKTLWQDGYPVEYTMHEAAINHGKGPKSTPAHSDGRLYTIGITGVLSCYDAAKGKLLWRKESSVMFKAAAPLYGTAASPVVDRGVVIAYMGGHDDGGLMAFNAETGAEKWRWTGDGPGYASPIEVEIAGTRQIVTQSQRKIIGISAESGELLWQIPFETEYVMNIVTPIAYKDLLIFSGYGKSVFAVKVERREGRWAANQVWENKEVAMYMNSPVLNGHRLFGMSHRNKGQFFCLDADTGKTLWTGDPRQAYNSAMLIAGDLIFALTDTGDLIVSKVTDNSANPFKKYSVSNTQTWAHPVIVEKSILIKDETSLSMWDME
jgi:outer membrane protein assembly factor BamB